MGLHDTLRRRPFRLLAGFLALWMVAYPIMPAYASPLQWNTVSTGFYTPKFIHDEKALEGNIAYVNNNLGAAILKIPGNEVGNVNFGIPYNTPVVFAEYDSDSSIGMIEVMRLLHMPDSSVLVESAIFSPQDGSLFDPTFEGVNPFWQFIPNQAGNNAAPAGTFMNVNASAFWTAVGLVMQHEQSNQGWIAVNQDSVKQWNTNTCVDNTFLGCIRRKYTAHEQVSTSPDWVFVVPNGEAPGTGAGFLLPLPGTSPGGVALRKTALILGVPASATLNNQTVGALKVQAGVTFVNQGIGNNLPHQAFTSFYHQQSTTSWSGLGLVLLAPVLMSAIIIKAALDPLSGSPLQTLSNITNLAVNTFMTGGNFLNLSHTSGSYTSPVGGFSACYGGSANCAGSPMISAFNLSKTMTVIGSQSLAQGTSGITTPLQQSNAWDPRPSIATGVATAPTSAQGGFAVGYNNTAITPAQAQKTNAPLSVGASGDVTDSSGAIIFDSPTAGNSLP